MAVPDKEPAATLMRDDPLTGLATDIRLWAAASAASTLPLTTGTTSAGWQQATTAKWNIWSVTAPGAGDPLN